jgi:hypothetical protein
MTFTEAIDVLKRGRKAGDLEKEARNTIAFEIRSGENLSLTLTTLAVELTQSTNPAFSYQILRSILASENEKIEDDVAMQFLKIPSSNSVRQGIAKCIVALSACTKFTGE